MTEQEQSALIDRMAGGHGVDCTGQTFTDWPAKLFDGKAIINCCFSHETPDTEVFPKGVKGMAFERCNLDNVAVPVGSKVTGCCTRRFKCFPLTPGDVSDEGAGPVDWIVNEKGEPVEPMDKRRFEEEGRSLSPKDIPDEYEIERTISEAEFNAIAKGEWEAETTKGDKPLSGWAAWFKEKPTIIQTIPTAAGNFLVVRGKAWLHRGETATDATKRKQVLADVRKAVK